MSSTVSSEDRVRGPALTTGQRIKAYVELTKPRIIELLLITTVPAMVVAAGGWPGTWLAVTTLIGGTLSAAGANTINQVVDRDIDIIMERTAGRPIPTNRVTPRNATIFGIVLGVAGFGWLWVTTNLLAGVLSTSAFLFYVFVYTLYLKRATTQNIVIGGAAGAVPPLVGWAAVTGNVSLAAWIMFAIVFYWTPPHFWALSLKYEDQYAAAGVPMLPVVVGTQRTLDSIMRYTLVLVAVSLLLSFQDVVGVAYTTIALALGLFLIWSAWKLRRGEQQPMKFFGWTNLYLAGIFLGMMVDPFIG